MLTPRQRWDLALFLTLLGALIGVFVYESRLSPPKRDEIDLLPLVRTDAAFGGGRWTREGPSLQSPPLPWSRVQVPYAPPEEYDLTLSVRRMEGLDSLNLGLAVGGRQFMVVLDGESGSASWIDRIESGAPGQGVSRHSRKIFLQKDTPVAVTVSVRKIGVAVTVNGATILDWKGSLSALSLFPNWKVPDSRALFLGSFETSYRIDRLTLTPVTGDGTVLR
jgi:hypothetical protein